LFGQRTRLSFSASVIHCDIEAAKALDGLVHEIAHVVFMPDIGAHEFRFGAQSAQFSDQRLTSIVPPTGNYDARTFLSKRESGRAPDAGERARDEYHRSVHMLCLLGD
jgi:hypothetical protein